MAIMKKKVFCALSMVFAVGLMGAPAMAQSPDPFVWLGFEGENDHTGSVVNIQNGELSLVSPDVPVGGGNYSLLATWPPEVQGFLDSPLGGSQDFSEYNFINFYLKSPDLGNTGSLTILFREAGGVQAPWFGGPINALPGYEDNEWFYVSIEISSLVLEGGFTWATVNDFLLFTRNDNETESLEFYMDHLTLSSTPEAGMLGGSEGEGEGEGEGPEQDAESSFRAVAGASVCYDVTNAGDAAPGSFTWTFDDGTGAVALAGVVDGQLCFNPLTEADAGTYVAMFEDGSKVANTFTLVLEVLPEGTAVPASTNWTLLITILAIALSAGTFFGRKAIRQ
jgi:hypothetical protein